MSMLPVYRLPTTVARSAPTTTPSFETCLSTLRLAKPGHGGELDPPVVGVAGPYAIDPATSERNGSITHDRKTRNPTHEWNSLNEFHVWRMNEERDRCIELQGGKSYPSVSRVYRETRTYVCSRQGAGGKSKYTKKYKDRIRARSNKRTGCGCRVIIKTYHHVSTVLGWYKSGHDHATGMANLMYTRIPDSTRAYVLGLLRTGMGTKEALTRVRAKYGEHERGHYITPHDIYRLRKIVEREKAIEPISGDQPSDEHSEEGPAEVEELATATTHGADEAESQQGSADEEADGADRQSDGCASAEPDLKTPTSDSANAQAYTPEAGTTTCVEPIAPWPGPAAQMAPYAVPCAPPPYYGSMPPYLPPPLAVYMPFPPYQMVLYPVHPTYFPSPPY